MSGRRSVVDFVTRYVDLAGRNCCSGKSWAALDRTLQKHACDAPAEADSVEPAERQAPVAPEEPAAPPEPAVTLAADDARV